MLYNKKLYRVLLRIQHSVPHKHKWDWEKFPYIRISYISRNALNYVKQFPYFILYAQTHFIFKQHFVVVVLLPLVGLNPSNTHIHTQLSIDYTAATNNRIRRRKSGVNWDEKKAEERKM